MPTPVEPKSPYRPVDEDARELARRLLGEARYGALAATHPDTGHPHVSRILLCRCETGSLVTLISTLALHTRALMIQPSCAVLVGEPKDRGDPLVHPRITVTATARFLEDAGAIRDEFLEHHPKSALYAGFADFRFVQLDAISAELNGGFGKAYRMTPADIGV